MPSCWKLLAREFVAMRYRREGVSPRTRHDPSLPADERAEPGASPSDDTGGGSPFVVASLKTESPEQLAWSVMQALGLVAQGAVAGPREARRPRPQNASYLSDPTPRERHFRLTMIEEGVHDQLQKNVASFVRQFAAAQVGPRMRPTQRFTRPSF